MAYKILFLSFFLSLYTCCRSQTVMENKILVWNDSLLISEFINNSSLCEKLALVIDSPGVFVAEIGFSTLILEKISFQTREAIFIPISNGHVILDKDHRVHDLKKQMNKIKNKFCRKGKVAGSP
jgi:hypothetical protein